MALKPLLKTLAATLLFCASGLALADDPAATDMPLPGDVQVTQPASAHHKTRKVQGSSNLVTAPASSKAAHGKKTHAGKRSHTSKHAKKASKPGKHKAAAKSHAKPKAGKKPSTSKKPTSHKAVSKKPASKSKKTVKRTQHKPHQTAHPKK